MHKPHCRARSARRWRRPRPPRGEVSGHRCDTCMERLTRASHSRVARLRTAPRTDRTSPHRNRTPGGTSTFDKGKGENTLEDGSWVREVPGGTGSGGEGTRGGGQISLGKGAHPTHITTPHHTKPGLATRALHHPIYRGHTHGLSHSVQPGRGCPHTSRGSSGERRTQRGDRSFSHNLLTSDSGLSRSAPAAGAARGGVQRSVHGMSASGSGLRAAPRDHALRLKIDVSPGFSRSDVSLSPKPVVSHDENSSRHKPRAHRKCAINHTRDGLADSKCINNLHARQRPALRLSYVWRAHAFMLDHCKQCCGERMMLEHDAKERNEHKVYDSSTFKRLSASSRCTPPSRRPWCPSTPASSRTTCPGSPPGRNRSTTPWWRQEPYQRRHSTHLLPSCQMRRPTQPLPTLCHRELRRS